MPSTHHADGCAAPLGDGADHGVVAAAATSVNAPLAEPSPSVDFATVFAGFSRYVPGLLRRLGVAEREVEDVAQDVFTVVHRQLPGFRGDSTLKTWICGITLRVARRHLRLARVRRLFLGEPSTAPACEATQFEAAALKERVIMLEHALAQLSFAQRRVFVLYELEELSMREIAGVLGCPEKTAYTRLAAARQNIERVLRRKRAIGGAP